jgi:hypothetical protein
VGYLDGRILTWFRGSQRPFRRKWHSRACFDWVELTGYEHREVARMLNVASELARLIAGPPIDIRTRRADDR